MESRRLKSCLAGILILISGAMVIAQESVPLGIHYQAVARDNYGKELVNKKISVKFSVIAADPLSQPVFQEVQDVTTTRFGVFSLVIGHGTPTGNSQCQNLGCIQWELSQHYLKVEVKFENDFMDMGTMPFLSVPYALYAGRSLEPGPAGPQGAPGPKGDPGDPASDDQSLSIVNIDGSDYLKISGGNEVKISSIEKDGDITNEIQDLTLNNNKLKITRNPDATEWDLTRYLDNTDSQNLTWDGTNRVLGISGNATTINLSELKNDADASPTNEIQNLSLSGNTLTLSGDATPVDLTTFKDNTDSQTLDFNEANNSLSITGGNSVQLSSTIAFRAQKATSETVTTFMSDYNFYTGPPVYNDGGGYDYTSGEFTTPVAGIYTFNVSYFAFGGGNSRVIKIYLDGSLYEILNSDIASGSSLTRSVTMKLAAGKKVKVMINVGTGFEIGTGYFSGFKVN